MFLHRMEMSNLSLDLDFPFLVVGTSCWLNRVSDGQGFSKGLCFVCLLGMALFSCLCQTRPIIAALCLVFMFSLVTTHPICQCFRLSRKFSWDLFFCGPLEGIAFYSAPNPNCSAVKSSWPIRPQKRSEVRNLEDLTDVTVREWNYCRKWVHNTFFVPTAKSHALLPNHIPYIFPIQIVIYCTMYILIIQYRHTDYCIDNHNKSSLY